MYLNSKSIKVSPAAVFNPGFLIKVASLVEKTVFPGCDSLEVQVNCSLNTRSIGGSLSALKKLNPEDRIDSFIINFQNGPFIYFTVEKKNPSSGCVTASIAHPDLQQSLHFLEEFCRVFPA